MFNYKRDLIFVIVKMNLSVSICLGGECPLKREKRRLLVWKPTGSAGWETLAGVKIPAGRCEGWNMDGECCNLHIE